MRMTVNIDDELLDRASELTGVTERAVGQLRESFSQQTVTP